MKDGRLAAPLRCNGCTACCKGPGRVMLHPALGDDPGNYTVEVIPNVGVALMTKADGSCFYLADGVGCTIYPDRPALCRAFDCRVYVLSEWSRHDPHPSDEVTHAGWTRLSEALSDARYLAYYESPRGHRRRRIKELLRKRRSAAEQRELDHLCRCALEDGENWPSRRELLQSKPAFERPPAEILELEALNQQNASYPAERGRVRALQELQLQERRKNPNYYKMQVPEPCPACRRSSETI
jgi:Fe-S-cluster containining protein